MQKKVLWSLGLAAGSCACLWAANWPSVGGNPQRDGYANPETHVSTANAKDVKLLYKHKFDVKGTIFAPIDVAQVIGYTGFHEFLWTGASNGAVFQNDADLNYEFKHIVMDSKEKSSGKTSALCPGGTTASPILSGGSSVGRFGGGGGFRALGLLWALNEDGYLHTMRQQDSDNKWIPAQKFLPAGSNVSALNMSADYTFYAPTINSCSGGNGLYAMTFTMPEIENEPLKPFKKAPGWSTPVSFMTNGAGFAGAAGTALGTKTDAVFGTVPEGKGDVAGTYSDTVLKLDPKTLAVKDYFTPSDKEPAYKAGATGVTPAVFAEGGKDYVVAGDRSGHIYLLDSTALGGSDHHTPVASTDAIVAADASGNNGIFGTFATFVDAEHGNTRWLFAAVRGPVSMKFPGANGAAANGGIVAFKIDFAGGRPKLVPAWSSADMVGASGPAIAGGVVYALASGWSGKAPKPASLFLLEAATGKQLYASAPAATYSSQPIAFANGHAYFVTHDNTLYQYGIPEEK
jgi:hypothetical protein